MNCKTLVTGPDNARATFILAHGAGGAMDSEWMNAMCTALSQQDLQVIRFEFDYMASRRRTGKRSPPPPAAKLKEEYKTVISEVGKRNMLVVGGKSMGGRIASMIADDLYEHTRVSGLLCLGYPFHPIGKPDALRTAHFADLRTPTLICQGTRDQFGSKDEVASYLLSPSIALNWMEDGDHDLKPRKSVSRSTLGEYLDNAAKTIASWVANLKDG